MVARPSDPSAFAFIRQMLHAAGYVLVEQQRARAGGAVRRVYVRPCNDRFHLELWQYVDRNRSVRFFDLLLWRNDDLAPGRAVKYEPLRNDLTDVVGAFSHVRHGIGTRTRDLESASGALPLRRRPYKMPDDVRALGFGDRGGVSPQALGIRAGRDSICASTHGSARALNRN